MKGETIDYRTHVQYKILDAVEYILDNYGELDQEVLGVLRAELEDSYKPYRNLEPLRDVLWSYLTN